MIHELTTRKVMQDLIHAIIYYIRECMHSIPIIVMQLVLQDRRNVHTNSHHTYTGVLGSDVPG